MDKIKGVIQKVETSSGIDRNNKPYKRWVFSINEKKYSTFEENIGTSFNPGEFVEMEGEQAGQYWNMQTMKALKGEIPQEVKEAKPSNNETDNLLRQILAELKDGDN